MNILFEEHRKLLEALLKKNVEFILIVGYAVNYYGYNRSTGDLDIWIKPDNDNKVKLLTALGNMGFDDEGIAVIRNWDFTQPQKFHIGAQNQPDKTEFMTHISGVRYDEADQNKIIAEIEGLKLPVIHYNNLIKNKQSSGRLKDLADVEYLEKILQLKNKNT
jgi:sulfur carrier protein ThiS